MTETNIVGHCKTCGVPMTSTSRGFVFPDRTIECEPCFYGGTRPNADTGVTSTS